MIVRPLKKIYEPYLQYSTTHTVASQNRNTLVVMISFYQYFFMIWILKAPNMYSQSIWSVLWYNTLLVFVRQFLDAQVGMWLTEICTEMWRHQASKHQLFFLNFSFHF